MNVSLAQAAAALNANARWQESISDNLAGSSIPGFKKQEISFAAIGAGLMPVAGASSREWTIPELASATNFEPGEQKVTGVSTDVALQGPGFIAVLMPDGSEAYTRDGELRLDSSGQLISKSGYPVLGTGGPIQIDLSNSVPISISATGEVTQGTDNKGTLRAVEFNNPHLLTPVSHGLFVARNPGLAFEENANTTFRQGCLEGANTSAASEMAQLIAAMRIYEANQRVLQTHDDRMGQTIAELGGAS